MPNLSFALPLLEWINIPLGEIGIEDIGYTVGPFAIAKYPVTNLQFQSFIDDGGYREDRFWQGLFQRNPLPTNPKWSEPTCPRENVNWFEAIAFTRWLSEKTGRTVTLPTEAQWLWAAMRDKGWAYPYGNSFDRNKSNTSESRIRRTTPVDRYLQGASLFGVMDMSGNIWEWCLNVHNDPKNTDIRVGGARGLRGGSWQDDRMFARSEFRFANTLRNPNINNPLFRFNDHGFRVLASDL